MKLSFIIPVYNVAPYLRKCVDSLVHQDFSDYEIVLIDDGSTDESGKICDELSESIRDERLAIRVIYQENGGLSAARNTGLKVAKGDYVCFVDSDDYWEKNVLGGLMEQVEQEKLDVLRFDYRNVRLVKDEGVNGLMDERKYEVFEPNKTPRYIDKCNEVVDGVTYLNTRMGYACYAVMFIMRREAVPAFTQGIHFEDTEWLPKMMLETQRVNSTTTIVYNYLIRQGSITKVQGDKRKIQKNIEDSLKVIKRYNCYIDEHPRCHWLHQMRSNIVVNILSLIAQYLFGQRKIFLRQLKQLGVFPLTFTKNQNSTYVRKACLINISPLLFVDLLHIKNGK